MRPQLEYNSVVWSLYSYKDITTFESVQKRFSLHVKFLTAAVPLLLLMLIGSLNLTLNL